MVEPLSEPEVVASWVPDSFASSPKRILQAIEDLGWTSKAGATRVHHPDTFLVAGDRIGELKTAAHDVEHLWIAAKHKQSITGFIAHWTDNRFTDAVLIDPIGIPMENWVDYKAPSITRGKDETEQSFERRTLRAEQDTYRQNYEYNDGSSRLEHKRLVDSANEFNQWMNDWLELWAPGAKLLTIRASRKKVAPTTEQINEAILAGEEWAA